MLFTAVPALLSLALAGFAAAAPAVTAPPVVNCNAVGVHTPGRSPPSPDRTAIEITGAFSEPLWALSDWTENDGPDGGVWGDRATHTPLSEGRLAVKLRNWRVVEELCVLCGA